MAVKNLIKELFHKTQVLKEKKQKCKDAEADYQKSVKNITEQLKEIILSRQNQKDKLLLQSAVSETTLIDRIVEACYDQRNDTFKENHIIISVYSLKSIGEREDVEGLVKRVSNALAQKPKISFCIDGKR